MTFTKNLSRFTIPANPPSNAAPERLLDQFPPAIFPAIAPKNPVDKARVEAFIHDKHRYDHTPITPLSDAIEVLYSAYPNHQKDGSIGNSSAGRIPHNTIALQITGHSPLGLHTSARKWSTGPRDGVELIIGKTLSRYSSNAPVRKAKLLHAHL